MAGISVLPTLSQGGRAPTPMPPGHSKNDLELANPIGQIMPDQRTVPISKTVKLAEINPVAGL